MQPQKKKLYFCKGMIPTDVEFAEAKTLGISAFRNASEAGDYVEKVDSVAGAVPEAYRKAGVRVIQVEQQQKGK